MLSPIVAPSGLLTDRFQCEDTRYGSFTVAHRHATAASTPDALPWANPAVGRPPEPCEARLNPPRGRSTSTTRMPLHGATPGSPRAACAARQQLAAPAGESASYPQRATRAWIGSYIDSAGGEPVPSYRAQQAATTFISIPRCHRPRHHAPRPRSPASGVKADRTTGRDTMRG